jgi:hypothetical protein
VSQERGGGALESGRLLGPVIMNRRSEHKIGLSGFGFTDLVMDKIAFNDPYRFLAANIPSRSDLL